MTGAGRGGSARARSLPLASAADSGYADFFRRVTAVVNDWALKQYRREVLLVEFPGQGDFPWYWENSELVFNSATFGYVSARVSAGNYGLARLSGPGGYPNAYAQLLSQVECPAAYGSQVLDSLRRAVSQPTGENGGMQTVDPDTGERSGYQVGYVIGRSLAALSNTLESGRPELPVQVTGLNGETVSYCYRGCQLVPVEPAGWQQATGRGWHDPDPLAEAFSASRDGQPRAAGYQFTGTPAYNLGPLAAGGDFGRLAGLLICDLLGPDDFTFRAPEWPSLTQGPSGSTRAALSLIGLPGRSRLAGPRLAADAGGAGEPVLQQRACVIGVAVDTIA